MTAKHADFIVLDAGPGGYACAFRAADPGRKVVIVEPLPPEADRLVADVDASFVQQVLDVAQRQREPDVQHHRQADDLGACLEGFEGRMSN